MKGVLVLLALAAVAASAASVPGRIVGGESTTIENYPDLVQVEFQGVFTGNWAQSCAGNILTSRFVLSAAHCFVGVLYNPSLRRIRAGSTYRNTGGQIHNVLREYVHADYAVIPRDADIVVVELASPISYNAAVQPGTIVEHNSIIPDNVPVVHAGWGTLQSGGSQPPDLQHVEIYTINNGLCEERYLHLSSITGINYPITSNMICAGIIDVGGKDACQGDSGGPLYLGGIMIGVVSWGWGCANETYPGVSAAIAPFTPWIVQIASG